MSGSFPPASDPGELLGRDFTTGDTQVPTTSERGRTDAAGIGSTAAAASTAVRGDATVAPIPHGERYVAGPPTVVRTAPPRDPSAGSWLLGAQMGLLLCGAAALGIAAAHLTSRALPFDELRGVEAVDVGPAPDATGGVAPAFPPELFRLGEPTLTSMAPAPQTPPPAAAPAPVSAEAAPLPVRRARPIEPDASVAQATAPVGAAAHVTAGWDLLASAPATALAHFDRALADAPTDPDAAWGRVQALTSLRREDDALRAACRLASVGGGGQSEAATRWLSLRQLTCR